MKRMTMPLKRQLTAQTLAFAVMVFGLVASADYTLTDDESWTAADVTTKMTGVINLNGHTLTVPELKGNATITDTSKTYELLEYIKSTGSQYINTGVIGKPGLTASVDFSVVSAPYSNHILLGSRKTSGGADRFYILGYKGASNALGFWFQHKNDGQVLSTFLYRIGEMCHVEVIASNSVQKLSVEGKGAITAASDSLTNTEIPLYLFDSNVAGKKGGFGCSAKLYAATISASDGVTRNFVPVRRCSDGAVGLLDLANRGANEFYANEGTGTFTAGAVTNYIYATDVATASSELHVEVAAGETRTNETVTLSGALKLVKKGAGTFVAAKSGQTYLDGTVVEAGTFRVAAADEKTNCYVGVSDRAVTVGADATLDVNGNPDFTSHPLVLAGGTLKNGATTDSKTQVGAVTLTANSTVSAGYGITHTANVVLGGNTLTVKDLDKGEQSYYRMAAGVLYTGPGTVSVSGGFFQFDGTTARNMRTVDLAIASAVNLSAHVTVSNLTSTYTGRAGTAGTEPAKFLVTGTYTASSFHRGCEMRSGSTLDLSALTGPVSNVTFAADAAITVALGTRTDVGIGDCIVSWDPANKPSDTVTFLTVGEGWESLELKVQDDGLCLSEPYVANAVWTGEGDDPTDVNAPANWRCTNIRGTVLKGKIPTDDTVVTLPNGCTNSFPVGGAFLAREVVLPATLGADNLDWRGITAPFSGTLDLQGRKLTVSHLTGDCEITDTAHVEYELLEYIQSTGTQYIDTGVVGKPGLTITTDFAIQTISANSIFIGSRKTNDGADRFYPIGYTPTYLRFWIHYVDGAVYSSNNSCALQHKYHAVATASSTAQTLEIVDMETGTSVKMTDNKTPVDTDQNMYLFNANVGGGLGTFPCAVKFYGMAISTDEGIRRDFVPVRQISTGKVGLLDLANRGANEFYANKGKGTFTAGAVTGYICNDTAPGELHVCVASGALTNETVTLAGGLKLVKDGAGTFVAAKSGQTYAGGTEVAAGTFRVGTADESVNRFAGTARSAVTVEAGATLDVNGNIGFEKHPLVLAGGTVKSSGTSNYLVESATLGNVTLTADSTVNPNQHIRCTGLFDLGTHTLTLTPGGGKYFELTQGALFTNGFVNATTGGYIAFQGDAARDMRTVDLRICCGTRVESDITVRDLALGWWGGTSYAYGDGRILITGTYTPLLSHGYHRNCVMQDGSTLNLAEQAGAWSLEPGDPPSGKDQACTPLAFAEGATINVTLGDRRPKSGPIVTWQEGNDPGDKVTFVLDPSVNARLVRKPEGLWLQTGLLIRIR